MSSVDINETKIGSTSNSITTTAEPKLTGRLIILIMSIRRKIYPEFDADFKSNVSIFLHSNVLLCRDDY